MRYAVMMSAVVGLVGCTAPTSLSTTEQAYASFPEQCHLHAPLPTGARVQQATGMADAMKRAGATRPSAGFHAQSGGTTYSSLCACSDAWDADKITRRDVSDFITGMTREDWRQPTIRFIAGSPKNASFSAERDTFIGKQILSGRAIFDDRCVMAFYATGPERAVSSIAAHLDAISTAGASVRYRPQ